MARMIFPQGNVPILSNPNGYRDDPSVLSTIADMFQARKQMREGNEQQVAAVFEQEAAKLDPETRAVYYRDFIEKNKDAAKWLRGWDVQRPMTMAEQVGRMQNEATMGALGREKQMAPGSVEQKVLDYVRQTNKNPTAAMIAEMVSQGTLTPQEYEQGVRVANGLAMSANQEQQSKDRRYGVDTGAATSRANTQASINAQTPERNARTQYINEKRTKLSQPASAAKLTDVILKNHFATAKNLADDIMRNEQEVAKGTNKKTAKGGDVAKRQLDGYVNSFNIRAKRVGFPMELRYVDGYGLRYIDTSDEMPQELAPATAGDSVAFPAQPEAPETHRLNQPDAPDPTTHDLVYDENGNATWVPK